MSKIFDKTGIRAKWYSFRHGFHSCVTEFAGACHLFLVILLTPIFFLGLLSLLIMRGEIHTRCEVFRSCCEMFLFYRLWQETDTNIIAIGAWICWTVDLHMESIWSCRCVTWLTVCLAQQEVRIAKLLFLIVLVYKTHLFGKKKSMEKYDRRVY